MENIYPMGPEGVSRDFAKPTRNYKNKAWLAVGGLGLFIALYFLLAGWFVLIAYRLLAHAVAGGGNSFWVFIAGVCAAFFAVFMFKALFLGKQNFKIEDKEVTAEQQPRLFEFLYRLADDAGAPRPHRVFLSPRVNASVFYNLSVLNLIYPSKKNLEIGLGLVNVLSLSEFKAVCAHEFGHFAQRSMAVGRWVYTAQQIASKIVARRDALDGFLNGLARIDIRVAWIGWIMQIIVWSIRSLIDFAFRGVVLAQRALSREMEMQADLVAVSLSGSDTLIHALHRLGAADDAWDRAARFAWSEAANKSVVRDVYALQSRIIEHLSVVLDDPLYGKHPPLPSENPEMHRLFRADFALPPTMWSTHPLNFEREENAKRRYVPVEADNRSAWTLFDDAQSLREEVSARLAGTTEEAPVLIETSLAKLDEQYACEYFKRAYRGAYLGRPVTLQAAQVADLFDAQRAASVKDLDLLYPESLAQDLEQVRNLEKEVALLESLRDKTFVPMDGVIRYRGKEIRRNALPDMLIEVLRERAEVREKIWAHDYLCRSVHLALAKELGQGWDAYLRELISMLHYADHSVARLREVHDVLRRRLNAETAGGQARASSDGVVRIIAAAGEAQRVLDDVYTHAHAIVVDDSFVAGFGTESFEEKLGKFGLLPPHRENISNWLNAVDSWFSHTQGVLQSLGSCALDRLLTSEAAVAGWAREGATPDEAPLPVALPESREAFVLDTDRTRDIKPGAWQRFQSAQGWTYGLARFAVAGGIIGGVLLVGSSLSSLEVAVYNGLGRTVQVSIDNRSVTIPRYSYRAVGVSHADSYHVETRDESGRVIESFDGDTNNGNVGLFYNVAGASPLVQWTATYGAAAPQPPKMIGAVRWGNTSVDDLFKEPPQSIKSKTGGIRTVLSAAGSADATETLSMVPVDAAAQVVAAHARWDERGDRNVAGWLNLAMKQPGGNDILRERAERDPNDILSLRYVQDSLTPDDAARFCQTQTAQSQAFPDNPNFRYIAIRCMPESPAKLKAFDDGHRRWPQHGWFAYAAGYTAQEKQDWAVASNLMAVAMQNEPALTDNLSLELARMRRLQKADPRVDVSDLAAQSPSLRMLLAIDSGKDIGDGPLTAYHDLATGHLDAAIAKAKGTGYAERITRLAAASTGASRALMSDALALPLRYDESDEISVFAAIAVALRTGRDIAPYHVLLERMGLGHKAPGEFEQLYRFAMALRDGKVAEADRQLDGLSMQIRGIAHSMGVSVLGARAPRNWQIGARCILFGAERPYLG
ncbi:M48 family metallopeptidase [Herbaspirillum rhizosphaerae]|uniref:M48 family metallopeptidase n=1 Tax=Herbaspirillum rhizosphaerae TaxID=346179 RepID=UPI0009F8F6E5|nr:M48 family metallopeptidase [Herbaspirillum rhizosphaerae]